MIDDVVHETKIWRNNRAHGCAQRLNVPDAVHAPSRLTMLVWWPMCVNIFSSDIRASFSTVWCFSLSKKKKAISASETATPSHICHNIEHFTGWLNRRRADLWASWQPPAARPRACRCRRLWPVPPCRKPQILILYLARSTTNDVKRMLTKTKRT